MIAGITEKEQKITESILDKYRKDYAFFYYGSRVKGTYEKTSDLDVLIKGKAEMPLAVLQEIKEEFDNSDLPYIVNFSDYYKLDSSFYERIKPDLIPYNWQEVKLGDVCRFQNGYAFKSSQFTNNGNIKIIKIKEIKDGKIIFFDDSASVYYDDKYKKYQAQNDDILVALTGDPVARPNPASWVGRIAIFRGSEKALINQRVAKFLPNKTVLFPQFIYYFFRDFNNFYNLAKKATGSASQANISTDMLENTEILLPPLEVQKKIAGVLGALDDTIDLNNKINQNLEAQAQALFKSWFIDFEPFGGQMPSDWKIGKLKDIIKLKRNTIKAGENSQLPYLPIDVIPMNSLAINEVKANSEAQSSLITFEKDDILIGAMRVYFHRVIIAPCAGITRTTCFVLSPFKKEFLSYAILLCNQNSSIEFAQKTSKGSTMPYAIWEGGLGELDVPIPSQEIAEKFNNIIFPLIKQIQNSYFENKRLAELRDTLLPKLMSGEINVDSVEI